MGTELARSKALPAASLAYSGGIASLALSKETHRLTWQAQSLGQAGVVE